MKKIFFFFLLSAVLFSCKKVDEDDLQDLLYALGWKGSDNTATIPSSVNSSSLGLGNQNPPPSFDLVPKFPPIGDQGQFGTCVAWAVAYNYKTAIEGMDRALGTSELAQTNNQLSPKYLFTAIEDSKKGADCNGTNFTDALDVVLQSGVATLQTVPYDNLNGCSKSNLQSSWNSEAAGHKINNYRKIAVNASTIKSYVSDNIPVIFGAKLGDNFMTWNSDEVITGHSGFDNTGIHAYHAMVVAGYDDSKGPNGAFKVINSWGTNWGDAGYIWVDYNFFVTDFCFGGNCYIASNAQGNNPPDVNPNVTGHVDLAPWAFSDNSTGNFSFPTERVIEYNIYNIGDQTASASSNWSLYYIYYNAYNANEYGFLFYNAFNTTIAQNTYECAPSGEYCIINVDIPSGDNFAHLFYGDPDSQSVPYTYYVPNITGYYYLVLFADPSEVFEENDEQNNFFYTTSQYPVQFVNGLVAKTSDKPVKHISEHKFKNEGIPSKLDMQKSIFQSAVSSDYPNAYSSNEIRQMILNEKKSGNFQNKLNRFKAKSMSKGKSSQGNLR